jgi:hypothetical protein
MTPGVLTVVFRIDPARESAASRYLESKGESADPSIPARFLDRFEALGTVHFGRWVLLPSSRPGDRDQSPVDPDPTFEAQIAMETNFDGPLAPHLEGLAAFFGDVLRFAPVGSFEDTLEGRVAFLRAHRVETNTPYRAHPNLPVGVIRSDVVLSREIRAFVDGLRRAGQLPSEPAELHARVVAFAKGRSDLDTGPHPRRLPAQRTVVALAVLVVALLVAGLAFAASRWLSLPPAYLVSLSLVVVALGLASIAYAFFAFVAWIERGEVAASGRARAAVIEAPEEIEDFGEDFQVQNALTHLSIVKRDRPRRIVLRVVLFGVGLLARVFFVHGKLATIDSIHCARWIRIDEGNRLLFFSNYDGSWESYLGEFVDKLSFWLTAVWSNTQDFPTTVGTFAGRGAKDEEWFKRWTRQRQLKTQVWYAAYPNLSVQNVLANARLREGLNRNLVDQELRDWLRLT